VQQKTAAFRPEVFYITITATMPLLLSDPEQTISAIITFLQRVFTSQHKTAAMIAVSGGIDSAVVLALLARALPREQIFPLMLPYDSQSIADSQAICDFCQIPGEQRRVINIKPIVDAAVFATGQGENEPARKGNLMARARMMVLFDLAKQHDALVCGTENKSEHFLGYFTRFGDAASDIEAIAHLYKTQVRQLAEHLNLPEIFVQKSPSAGLWPGQTDETELGFSYADADQVLEQLIDEKRDPQQITIEGIAPEIVQKVIAQVNTTHFKLEVPYILR
jgi:NAD+ synthase